MAERMAGVNRRAFLATLVGGVAGGAAAALLGGCGGGGGGVRRNIPVRGIVLEDDGNGGVRPAPAGTRVVSEYADESAFEQGTTANTNAEGRFTVNLLFIERERVEYALLVPAYRHQRFGSEQGTPNCATIGFAFLSKDGLVRQTHPWESNLNGSLLGRDWDRRAFNYAQQYGVDVAILADPPCIDRPIPTRQ